MNLYDKDGWLNYDVIYNIPATFIFIVGARGIGKTYGGVDYLITNKIPFMFTRRTQTQASLASNPLTSDIIKPIKARSIDDTFTTEKLSKTVDGLYLQRGDDTPDSLPFAYVTSISTGSNLRGFNGDNIKCIFFDEFIGQPEERPIKEEANAFLNLYETLNRNREISGQDPIKVIAAANSFNLANPLFIKLGLVTIAEKMRRKNREYYLDKKRGVCVIQPLGSPISEAKKSTAVYKLVGEHSDFAEMALNNAYQNDISDQIKSMPLDNYAIVVTFGDISIYKAKSGKHYYITEHISGTPAAVYNDTASDRIRFRSDYRSLWMAYLKKRIYFENYLVQTLFENAFKI